MSQKNVNFSDIQRNWKFCQSRGFFFHPVVSPVYQDTESFQWHSHGLGASESSPDLNELLSTHCHKRKTSLRTVFLCGVFFLKSTLLSNFLIWNRFLVCIYIKTTVFSRFWKVTKTSINLILKRSKPCLVTIKVNS